MDVGTAGCGGNTHGDHAASSLHDLLTIFLSTAGSGGILNVVNNTGGSSTSANPHAPVTVVSYP